MEYFTLQGVMFEPSNIYCGRSYPFKDDLQGEASQCSLQCAYLMDDLCRVGGGGIN